MASKKNKIIVISCVFGHIFLTLLILAIFFLYLSEPWRYPKRIQFYSKDDNYQKAEGCVSSVFGFASNESIGLTFEWVKYEDGTVVDGSELIVFKKRCCEVYCHDVVGVLNELEPKVGMIISFTFSKGEPEFLATPIVQISFNDVEILSYEDGKTAFLEHLSYAQSHPFPWQRYSLEQNLKFVFINVSKYSGNIGFLLV